MGTPRDRPDCPDRPKVAHFSPEYLNEVLTCRRIKATIASGITDPIKLAEVAGIPVCVTAKWSGVNSIAAQEVLSQLASHRRELYFNKQADLPRQPQREAMICAVCGVDLTGRSRIEKSSKVYCASPGCGYPVRGDAEEAGA